MRIERPKSLTELVADELRRQIIEGEVQLGEGLSESKIASQLDVSRTPVREAFARLDLEGLVTTEPQRGTYVFKMNKAELADICDARVCLETSALELAMERDRDGLAKTLREICASMAAAREAGDDRRYLRLDTEFHQALFQHAKNPYLNEAYQTLSSKMAALRNRLGAHSDHMQKSYDEHLRMAKAVAENDMATANTTLIYHIGRKEGSYWNL